MIDVFEELGKYFNPNPKSMKDVFPDNHKHLANTLIEIPKDTVAEWVKEAHRVYANYPESVKANCIELFLKACQSCWRSTERMKITQNENDLNWSDKLIEKDKRIAELEAQVESLKMRVK